jgi:cation diffusion facilitator family transporter
MENKPPESQTEKSIRKSLKSTLIGILVNISLVTIKASAGIFGNSFALLADAIESASDVIVSIIVWLGIRAASREPDEDHPYGHGKAEPIVGMLVGMMLVGSAIIIIIEAIKNIRIPHEPPASFTLWVLIFVILIKEVLFRYVLKVGNEAQSTAVKADAWHHRSDAITSAAVFIGITIALIGGKEYASADDWAALFASGIIIVNAFNIVRPAFNEVMDAAPSSEFIASIKDTASSVPHVVGLDKCLVRKMGFVYYVDLHVIVDGNLTVREGHDIAHLVKAKILESHDMIKDVLVHIEPA